ncbi:serine aminopeptidase domain-containing protein [Aquisphaera insulae]|uniref:serine aminopeptidase domain-containing protein n=1 Tax=Aquisphaera insulae TaxID=2712864 RepID=UPI00203015C3|nr:alpha/beta hydrolase [Aquisphaera insulae]
MTRRGEERAGSLRRLAGLLRRVLRLRGRPRDDSTAADPGPPRGLVIGIGGVGGLDFCGPALRHVLAESGLPYALRIFPWGHGFGRWYADLSRVADRDAKAALLADTVRKFRADRPGEPVFLVAKSGGTAVAVRAMELLPRDSVETAILLAPALSPGYDLTSALDAVAREMVVFWSPLDLIILGAGTALFGTADRVRGASAGLVGFRSPSAGPYPRLRQVRWTPGMASTGNLGGHVGPDSPVFLRKYIVPLLRPAPAADSC